MDHFLRAPVRDESSLVKATDDAALFSSGTSPW